MTSEIDIKTDRVCAMLADANLGAVLINGQHNFAWVTTGASNGIDLSRDAGAASVLVCKDGKRYLLANNIEIERMLAEQVSARDFEPVDYRWQDERSSPSFVFETAKQLVAGELANDAAIEAKIAECRYSLTEPERARFRELGQDASAAMMRTISTVSPGQSEIEIAEVLRSELAPRGISSIVTLVAADDRIARYRHPVPTVNCWNKTLLLVTCAKRNGLIASLSRVVNVGKPSDELKRKTESAAYVHASLQHATTDGGTGAELYAAARSAYEQTGFHEEIDRHHQGGATGYRTRDWVAHPQSAEIVRTHQAFAWNPSITGTKVEETCIVGDDDSIETITALPGQPMITTSIEGREYNSPDIISI